MSWWALGFSVACWFNGAVFASWMAWRANVGLPMPRWWIRLLAARRKVNVTLSPDFAVADRDLFVQNLTGMIEKARAEEVA